MSDIVHVAVAVMVNNNHEVCISLRHKDAHQGGLWEFPGGKVEDHETVMQALIREVKEELDIDIKHSRPLINIRHRYHDSGQVKTVELHVFKVLVYQGEASGVEGHPQHTECRRGQSDAVRNGERGNGQQQATGTADDQQ